jgi:hypothetical protein
VFHVISSDLYFWFDVPQAWHLLEDSGGNLRARFGVKALINENSGLAIGAETSGRSVALPFETRCCQR